MVDFSAEEILKLDPVSYKNYFGADDFGLNLASELTASLGYSLPVTRKTEGSSLVFTLGSELFLKITPSFLGDSIEAELAAIRVIGDQLPFPIPKIVETGKIRDWSFVVSKNVPGQQAKDVLRLLSPIETLDFAGEVGLVINAFNQIKTNGFERSFGPWNKYLLNRIQNCRSIHRESGNSHEWEEKIGNFIDKHASKLIDLRGAKLIHADLNHEHLMLQKFADQWRISGVIDLADAMNAPVELEFVLPILCFFKGNADQQKKLWETSKICPQFGREDYSNMMMALALQNRFIEFHDWFSTEIKNGASTIEDVAISVFPPQE